MSLLSINLDTTTCSTEDWQVDLLGPVIQYNQTQDEDDEQEFLSTHDAFDGFHHVALLFGASHNSEFMKQFLPAVVKALPAFEENCCKVVLVSNDRSEAQFKAMQLRATGIDLIPFDKIRTRKLVENFNVVSIPTLLVCTADDPVPVADGTKMFKSDPTLKGFPWVSNKAVGKKKSAAMDISQALTEAMGSSFFFDVSSSDDDCEQASSPSANWYVRGSPLKGSGSYASTRDMSVHHLLAVRRPLLSYEVAVWIGYGIFTFLAIYDRFDWNVWPRQTYSIGRGSAGSDRLVGYKPGPWSVVAYDVLARISGRFSIVAYNLLLLTRMRSIEHALVGSWVDRWVVDCSNIVNANLRLHKWNGIALCVLTLIHVWSIIFPCVFHGWKAQVVPGLFEWPLSERTPKGFKDANPETETMSLQGDDVFRMVEMTILLAILTPLSVKWLATRWHAAIHIHRFINVIYFVDIVRRHSHPHSWILNTPVFVLWLVDKVWSYYYHKHETETKRVKLGNDYMVLYWKHPYELSPTVGPDFFLREKSGSRFEQPHVFTCFKNRTNFDVSGCDEVSKGEKQDEWNFGVVIRVFRSKRVPRVAGADKYSHTMKMYDVDEKDLAVTAWGPNHGEMSETVKVSLLEVGRPVVLIGAGSGINYIIDCLQWIVRGVAATPWRTTLLFSTRDADLFDWTYHVVSSILGKAPKGVDDRVRVVLAMTGTKFSDWNEEGGLSLPAEEDGRLQHESITRMFGRIQFDKEIPMAAVVFAQGSSAMKSKVEKVCKIKQAKYYGGLGGLA